MLNINNINPPQNKNYKPLLSPHEKTPRPNFLILPYILLHKQCVYGHNKINAKNRNRHTIIP